MRLITIAVAALVVTAACTAAPADTPIPAATAPVVPPRPSATVTPVVSRGATTQPATPAIPSTAVACGDPSPAPHVLMFSDGAATELVIEWTGGPADATGWQFRTRSPSGYRPHPEQGWGASRQDTTKWRGIPESAVSSCSYRITGLRSRHSYDVQMRAKVPGGGYGVESNVAEGTTQYDNGRAPTISPNDVVKGDGLTRWRVHALRWTFSIPDGVLIRGGPAWINGVSGVTIFDHETGSSLYFSASGHELGRSVGATTGRDVHALFDYISGSVDVPGWLALHSGGLGEGDFEVQLRASGGRTYLMTVPHGTSVIVHQSHCLPRPCGSFGDHFELVLTTIRYKGSALVVALEHIGSREAPHLVTEGPWEVARFVRASEDGTEAQEIHELFDALVASLRLETAADSSYYR